MSLYKVMRIELYLIHLLTSNWDLPEGNRTRSQVLLASTTVSSSFIACISTLKVEGSANLRNRTQKPFGFIEGGRLCNLRIRTQKSFKKDKWFIILNTVRYPGRRTEASIWKSLCLIGAFSFVVYKWAFIFIKLKVTANKQTNKKSISKLYSIYPFCVIYCAMKTESTSVETNLWWLNNPFFSHYFM